MTYSCPSCGHEVEEIPEAVTIEIDRAKRLVEGTGPYDEIEEVPGNRYVETTKGHSDQSTHICPRCREEGWHMGWVLDGTPES